MAGALSSSSYLIRHSVLRPPPAPSSSPSLLSFFFCKPLSAIPLKKRPLRGFSTTFFNSLPTRPLLFSFPYLSLSSPPPRSLSTSQLILEVNNETDGDLSDDFDEEELEADEEGGEEDEGKNTISERKDVSSSLVSMRRKESMGKLPNLTVKEKKELASYAHSLGKKLKSQQVGKSGVTDSVVTALIETLEANELLKLKIHGTCPGEFEDTMKQLEEATGSVVVGQIGRTVIIYRPSLTKLKAEEKKKQAQRVYQRKRLTSKSSLQSKGRGQGLKLYGHGRRGSSRFASSP